MKPIFKLAAVVGLFITIGPGSLSARPPAPIMKPASDGQTDEPPVAPGGVDVGPSVVPAAAIAAVQQAPPAPAESRPSATVAPSTQQPAADAAAGRSAFENSCTQCHDAARATSKKKSFAQWFSTVRRMAGKEGTDIPSSDWSPIARYLASLSAPAGGDAGQAKDESAASPAPPYDLFATISTSWRGGNDDLENAGFFPEIWVGGEWHGEGPLSARVAACVTCHTEGQEGNRVELAQGSLRFDLARWCDWREGGARAGVEAGRLLVPFGAFSAQSQPGAFRTVTKPLFFNMGQNVYRGDLGPPVLPMPYSDEGVLVDVSLPLGSDWNATFDAYAVNGLRGSSSGLNFYQSRDYVDNNFEPAVGGRATTGNKRWRFGASLMSGRFNDRAASGPTALGLHYRLAGADLAYRYEDVFRFQFEYALRHADRLITVPTTRRGDEETAGFLWEIETLLLSSPRISLIARYDIQDRDAELAPAGSSLGSGSFAVRRFTWGIHWTLPGGSLLAINHEHWSVPAPLANVDVLGLRWVGAF